MERDGGDRKRKGDLLIMTFFHKRIAKNSGEKNLIQFKLINIQGIFRLRVVKEGLKMKRLDDVKNRWVKKKRSEWTEKTRKHND